MAITQESYDITRLETFLLKEFPLEMDDDVNPIDVAMKLLTTLKRRLILQGTPWL